MKKFILAGLGNPGKKYELTRHNVGFMFADYFADKHKMPKFSNWEGIVKYTSAKISDFEVYLVKPLTYMNKSGEALKVFLEFENLNVHDMIVCYDDFALPLGKIRIRKKGSDGGHKGMKSIIENFTTEDIKRLRIGINNENSRNLRDYVLSKFSQHELNILSLVMLHCDMAVVEMLKNSIDSAMSKFNL